MASFHPMKPEERVFLHTNASNPGASERVFGLLAGVVPFEEYRSMRSLFGVLGIAGVGRAIAAKAGLHARSRC